MVRDGREAVISAESVVPGDVLVLTEGNQVTADMYLTESHGFYVNQSNFTGESRPVKKHAVAQGHARVTGDAPKLRTEYPNLLFASTSVVSGSGRGVVLRTGMKSEFGKVAEFTQDLKRDVSPLQKEVERTCKIITLIAVLVGVIFYTAAYFFAHVSMTDSFIFSLGIVVAFVPEGMLPLVTLSLAVATQRMAKRHVVVKKLSSVETLGSTTVICSDKTGTLTQNELTVRKMWVSGREVDVTGVGFEPVGKFSWTDTGADIPAPDGVLRQTLMAFAICNNARLDPPAVGGSGRHELVGDPTEGSLKVAAAKAGINLLTDVLSQPRVLEIPFTSDRRRMTTVHEIYDDPSNPAHSRKRLFAFVKGSADELLARCDSVQWTANDTRPLDDDLRSEITDAVNAIARRGLRVLAAASKEVTDEDVAAEEGPVQEEHLERGLVFLGLSGMMDPPRPEVPHAVALCHRAGIRVIMITGDYGITAETIARQIGLHSADGRLRVITGHDLSTMDDHALKEALVDDCIFARVVPLDKLRVVQTLQSLGEVVAVTGDGVNDAPALKMANIGVAMGITGTDVAKEAADMILQDDNFASIVAAVEEGRGAFANIRKFLTYILTSNVAEAAPFIFYVFSRGRIPLALNAMQVLAVDLGTDMLPALALGCDPPERLVMSQPPRDKNDHLVNNTLLFRVFGPLGLLEAAAAMMSFYFHYWLNGYEWRWIDFPNSPHLLHSAQSAALLGVVWAQIGNLFACRTESSSIFSTSILNNSLIWFGITAELALVAALIYVPFLQTAFGTRSIPFWPHWIMAMTIWAPLILLTDEIRKLIWWRFTRDRPERVNKVAMARSAKEDERIGLLGQHQRHDYV